MYVMRVNKSNTNDLNDYVNLYISNLQIYRYSPALNTKYLIINPDVAEPPMIRKYFPSVYAGWRVAKVG